MLVITASVKSPGLSSHEASERWHERQLWGGVANSYNCKDQFLQGASFLWAYLKLGPHELQDCELSSFRLRSLSWRRSSLLPRLGCARAVVGEDPDSFNRDIHGSSDVDSSKLCGMLFTRCLWWLPYGDAFSGLTFSGGTLIKLEVVAKAFMYQRWRRGSRASGAVNERYGARRQSRSQPGTLFCSLSLSLRSSIPLDCSQRMLRRG